MWNNTINANGNSDIDIYSKDFDINGQLAKQYTFTLETKDKQNASNAKNTYPICRMTIVICYNFTRRSVPVGLFLLHIVN